MHANLPVRFSTANHPGSLARIAGIGLAVLVFVSASCSSGSSNSVSDPAAGNSGYGGKTGGSAGAGGGVVGPGEFPTGTSITFTPASSSDQSDIAIVDGKAAIEFRSYYAGTSVITATSSGLTPATITIISQGSPAWVAGLTPPTAARPYARYTGN